MNLCDSNEIKALLGRHGFHFSKSMGQNFLIQSWVPQEIAAASGAGPGAGVLEIGPGIGPLARELSTLADKVVSIELDHSLLPILAETLADRSNTEIIPGDVMKIDLPALVRDKFQGLTPIVCANLPYNITTPVITALLEADCFASVTVMIQREAAHRICAAPGTVNYGVFAILCQYYADVELLFDVPSSCFLPAPKVTSTVLRLTAKPPSPEFGDRDWFFRVVRAAFSQRRKTLLNSLHASFSSQLSKEEIAAAIRACGFPETVRGERLSLADFSALAKMMQNRD